jgi:uncharacterized membrane protein
MSDEEADTPAIEGVAAVVSDGTYTLFVADFSDTQSAMEAYYGLKAIEDGRTLEIEGVIVVRREDDGKMVVQTVTDHSTKSGLKWGVLGGVVLGVFFPPSIIGSALALGAGGAAIGKAREVHHRSKLADELADTIPPGHSGIVALVSDPGAVEIEKALALADRVVQSAVDDVTARDLKAAAKEIEAAEADS